MNGRSYADRRRLATDAQLQALVAVAECGGFTRAARQLDMSQSAVSHAVTALESSLGMELLVRNARGTRLTEVGERTVEHAREVLRLKALLRDEAASARGLREGVVRIGSFGPTSSRQLLPPILKRFARRYPKLEARVFEGSDQEVESWLREGRIDTGFVNLPNEEFDTIYLARDELVVLVHECSPLVLAGSIRADQLRARPFIMSTGGCEPAIMKLVDDGELDVRYRIREVQTIVEMVGRDAGFSIKPALSLPDPLPEGVVSRPLEPVCVREVGLAFPATGDQAPAVRAFLRVAASG